MVNTFKKMDNLIRIASQGHEMLQIRFQEIKKALKSGPFFIFMVQNRIRVSII